MNGGRTSRGITGSEWLLLGSAVGLASWATVSSAVAGGSTHAWQVGTVLAIVAYLVGRVPGARWPAAAPTALVVFVLVLLVAPPWIGKALGAPPSGRPFGPLGYANASAALYVLAAGASALVALLHRGLAVRAAAMTGAGLSVAMVLSSRSRAGVAVLVFVLASALVRRARRVRRARLALVTLLVLAMAGTWSLVLVGSDDVRGDDLPVVDVLLSTERLHLWGDAAALALGHPITGVGPGNFDQWSPTAQEDQDLFAAHSVYLLASAELGWPGLVLLLALFSGLLGALLRAPAVPAALVGTAIVVGVGAQAAVDYVLWAPGVVGGAALLAGSAVSAASTTGKPGLTPPAPVMP